MHNEQFHDELLLDADAKKALKCSQKLMQKEIATLAFLLHCFKIGKYFYSKLSTQLGDRGVKCKRFVFTKVLCTEKVQF